MKTTAKRTQIYLPADLYQQAFAYARGKRVSLASVVRLSLQDFLTRRKRPSPGAYTKDPLWKLCGVAKSREGDLSARHDDYLYGKSKTSRP